jgi:hypothetical protein
MVSNKIFTLFINKKNTFRMIVVIQLFNILLFLVMVKNLNFLSIKIKYLQL